MLSTFSGSFGSSLIFEAPQIKHEAIDFVHKLAEKRDVHNLIRSCGLHQNGDQAEVAVFHSQVILQRFKRFVRSSL